MGQLFQQIKLISFFHYFDVNILLFLSHMILINHIQIVVYVPWSLHVLIDKPWTISIELFLGHLTIETMVLNYVCNIKDSCVIATTITFKIMLETICEVLLLGLNMSNLFFVFISGYSTLGICKSHSTPANPNWILLGPTWVSTVQHLIPSIESSYINDDFFFFYV